MNVYPRIADLSWATEEGKSIRAGSLPFKKRRFPRLALRELCHDGNEAVDSKLLVAETPDSTNGCVAGTRSEEKMAAVALIAASVVTSDGALVHETAEEEPGKHGVSFFQQVTRKPCDERGISLAKFFVAAASDLNGLHDATLMSDADIASGKRIHRPRLMRPLPNGCRGRTSRNNNFCRRQPYNGSHFCKSHYQSLIISGMATEQELRIGKVIEDGEVPDIAFSGGLDGPSVGASADRTGLSALLQQDKRYTGAGTEIRCKATTTRGRECSYCAVNETKYCHLHAAFDTHPPPRRGGASVANAAIDKEVFCGLEDSYSFQSPINSKSGKRGKADRLKRKSPTMSTRRLSTTKNLEKHMVHARYPLLSTLATDKWQHRKVIVSAGPLSNHVGVVEKWGNGWISVRLPGVGLHNRRSFELCLHPTPDSEDELDRWTSAEKVAPRVELLGATKEGTKEHKEGFDNGPVGEAVTSPTSLMGKKPLLGTSTVHEVTPLTSCRVIGIDHSLQKGEQRVSPIMFPTCFCSSLPATVPESPVQQRCDVEVNGSHSENETKGITLAQASYPEGKFQLCINPPVDVEGNCKALPLMQRLLFAQGRRSAKNKLGLIFGTAALDRSRRSIYKPTKFAEKDPKKRANEGDFNDPVKRHSGKTSNAQV